MGSWNLKDNLCSNECLTITQEDVIDFIEYDTKDGDLTDSDEEHIYGLIREGYTSGEVNDWDREIEYSALAEDNNNDVIAQATKHKIDLKDANKQVHFNNRNGNRFGAQESIMVLDVCQGLFEFHEENEIEKDVIRFLNMHLFNIGYLEDKESWNEFSEIIANSDILEELQ